VEIPFPQRTVWVRGEGRTDLQTTGVAGGGAD
jgi:hypothetical protein